MTEGETSQKTAVSSRWGTKVYVVMLPNNVAKPGEANRKIIAWKLTRESAERVRDKWPGSYIVRGEADKK